MPGAQERPALIYHFGAVSYTHLDVYKRQVVDYNPPTHLDENNINGHILFGMTGRDVVTTVGNGKVLMKDREVKVIDVEETMARCREESAKLWKSIND